MWFPPGCFPISLKSCEQQEKTNGRLLWRPGSSCSLQVSPRVSLTVRRGDVVRIDLKKGGSVFIKVPPNKMSTPCFPSSQIWLTQLREGHCYQELNVCPWAMHCAACSQYNRWTRPPVWWTHTTDWENSSLPKSCTIQRLNVSP